MLKKSLVKPREIAKQYEKLSGELENRGVKFFIPGNGLHIDDEFLTLPKNVTEVPPHELGELLSAFTQQKMYIRTVLSWQEIEADQAKTVYLKESFSVYPTLAVKMSEAAKERFINNDPAVEPFYDKWRAEEQKLELLSQNLKTLEDAIFLISREISRRESDYINQTRQEVVNSKRR